MSCVIFLIFGFSDGQASPSQGEVHRFLTELYDNPSEVLQRQPEKTEGPLSRNYFEFYDLISGEFISKKDSVRKLIATRHLSSGRKARGHQNGVIRFFSSNQVLSNIDQIHEEGLKSATIHNPPWTDSYWPIYRGGIAHRYQEGENQIMSMDWEDHYSKREWPPAPMTSQDVTLLSPAEKYDLLVGDGDYTLTQHMWDLGKRYYELNGKVENWMGYCHGWAAASICEPIPLDTIEVMTPQGQKVPFLPADIKALTTVLWANGNFRTRFIGSRCNEKKPEKDEFGRVLAEECFDVNPGIWHIALVNQVGIRGESMILDATYDYEVWNQPIVSYSYSYFDPATKRLYDEPRAAMIPYSEFTSDLFKTYRSKDIKKILGIAMKLSYLIEAEPQDASLSSSDHIQTVTYYYDLELDDRGHILGGEWYHNAHPDFLWTPHAMSKAASPFDRDLVGQWESVSQNPVPDTWTRMAKRASGRGVPLGPVVRKLIEESREEAETYE